MGKKRRDMKQYLGAKPYSVRKARGVGRHPLCKFARKKRRGGMDKKKSKKGKSFTVGKGSKKDAGAVGCTR